MKNKKVNKAILLVAALAVITVIAAVVHLSTREDVPEGMIQISAEDETFEVEISELDYEHISGLRENAKGEVKEVDGQAILLREVLAGKGIEDYAEVSVVADDSYAASLTKAEVDEDAKAYLLQQEEGGLRLIVFGDENSKRSVYNVVQIIVK